MEADRRRAKEEEEGVEDGGEAWRKGEKEDKGEKRRAEQEEQVGEGREGSQGEGAGGGGRRCQPCLPLLDTPCTAWCKPGRRIGRRPRRGEGMYV